MKGSPAAERAKQLTHQGGAAKDLRITSLARPGYKPLALIVLPLEPELSGSTSDDSPESNNDVGPDSTFFQSSHFGSCRDK
jgi:hypothetical protein